MKTPKHNIFSCTPVMTRSRHGCSKWLSSANPSSALNGMSQLYCKCVCVGHGIGGRHTNNWRYFLPLSDKSSVFTLSIGLLSSVERECLPPLRTGLPSNFHSVLQVSLNSGGGSHVMVTSFPKNCLFGVNCSAALP